MNEKNRGYQPKKNDEIGDIPVIILAGGLGTRIKGMLLDTPKILAPFNGSCFLDILIESLSRQGLKTFYLALGYMSEKVILYLENKRFDKEIEIIPVIETEQLGTGGAIYNVLQFMDSERFFVVNGDTFLSINAVDFSGVTLESSARIGMAVVSVTDISRYGAVKIDENDYVSSFIEKGVLSGSGLINAGWYLIQRKEFLKGRSDEIFSLEYDFLMNLPKRSIISYRVDDIFIDYGTPSSYIEAQTIFLEQGLIE